MSAFKSVNRVSVYAAATLEHEIIDFAMKAGASVYTVMDARGQGKHGTVDVPFSGFSHVKIEFLVKPEVAEKLVLHLAGSPYDRQAVSACMETVLVAAGETF
jgi:nitrogen regulatory protein P-II 2